MRQIFVMTTDYKVQGEYEVNDLKRALDDISGNGCTAIDIKFDFNGDIIILITNTI